MAPRHIVLWGVLAGLACAWQGPLFVRNLRPERDYVVDFLQEWASARNALEGRPVYESLRETCARDLGMAALPEERFVIEVNAHPPSSVLLALPLAGLDYPDATLAWNLISLAALLGCGVILVRQLGIPWDRCFVLPVVALALACWPFQEHVRMGQLGMVLLFLLTGAWAAERSGRPWLAGLLLATATAIKIVPAFLLVYFGMRRRWPVVAAGLLGLLALTLLTAAVLGPETYRAYLVDVPVQVREWRSGWSNASLQGFWNKLFDPGRKSHGVIPLVRSPQLAWAGFLASAAVVTALLALAVRRSTSRADHDRTFAAAAVAMLLLAPTTWEHWLVLLVLPAAIRWTQWPASSMRRRVLVVLLVWLSLNPGFFYRLLLHGATVSPPGHALFTLSFSCYALLGLFVLAVRDRAATYRALGQGDKAKADEDKARELKAGR